MAGRTETEVDGGDSDYGSDFTADEEVLLSTLAQLASDQPALSPLIVTGLGDGKDEVLSNPKAPRITMHRRRKRIEYYSRSHTEAASDIIPNQSDYDSGTASGKSTFHAKY